MCKPLDMIAEEVQRGRGKRRKRGRWGGRYGAQWPRAALAERLAAQHLAVLITALPPGESRNC